MINRNTEDGFTAVELLVTLFIAAIFLFSGYQLYTQVTRDGREANQSAKISGILYEKQQAASATVTAAYPNGCVAGSLKTPPSDPGSFVTEQVEGIGSVTFTTTISCPQGTAASADLFLVKVKASYTTNGTNKDLEQAIYAN